MSNTVQAYMTPYAIFGLTFHQKSYDIRMK